MKWSQAIPLAEFAPSVDPTTQGVVLEAENVIPSDRGWRSAFSLADPGVETLTATCCGAVLARMMDGTNEILAGTGTTLYKRSGNVWSSVTDAGTSFGAATDQRWRWAMMGDYILAANGSNTIQVSNAAATFTEVASAPKARIIESVYGFIMAAGTSDAVYGAQYDRWWCSGLFDHTAWTPNVTTQATTGRLVDTPGPITGLRRIGANVVAYKASSMYIGLYVEPPTVWQWQLVSSNIGCASHEAVVNIGKAHLFCGNDNFYMYDGAQVLPIGEQVREWFFDQRLYGSYASRVQAAHDPARALVYWFYPLVGGDGSLAAAVVYNYRQARWGVATLAVEVAAEYVAAGTTYDGLGTYYTTYDAGIDRTYDSPLWVPGNVVPAVINTRHALRTIDGAGGSSSFTLWHIGDDQAYTLLRRARIRWIDAPDTATLDLYTLDEHGGTFALRASATENDNKFDLLASARWHKLKFSMTGTHELASVMIDTEPQGAW